MASPRSKQLLNELNALASSLGIKIRCERTNARGGMCFFKGIPIIIIDKNASCDYKINILIENIRKFDISDRYINPKLREIIENY